MLQSNLLTQNRVLIRTIKENPDKQIKAEPSVFGNELAATTEELSCEVERLMLAFPQMKDEFFGYVIKEAVRRGISRNRMEYIVNTLFETYHYPTITLADIFDIDKYVHELTPYEFEHLKIPHKPVAQIYFGGRYRFVYKEDAEKYGYPYKPFLSNAELDAKERREAEERRNRWYEDWKRKHPDAPEPEKKDPATIVQELVNQYTPKF